MTTFNPTTLSQLLRNQEVAHHGVPPPRFFVNGLEVDGNEYHNQVAMDQAAREQHAPHTHVPVPAHDNFESGLMHLEQMAAQIALQKLVSEEFDDDKPHHVSIVVKPVLKPEFNPMNLARLASSSNDEEMTLARMLASKEREQLERAEMMKMREQAMARAQFDAMVRADQKRVNDMAFKKYIDAMIA